ncbi:uncharacterized protein LAESUDRAFT_717391 [Laetiporus sulphureus 93-53]|uniref:Copper-fist domain-containing protein n=1 Tax=Laetiporus sulphureus 93-53 TaxID=1314785 RepID=A0A165BT90_9APHY|nr:uncharacterized protein LAESUDRAFT_717391 [Laetiporus sulphureus 93-53]KZT01608.1 hypothetical protein LAESUDRAFT_717391 [Laetiporus sulphureus 93-53]
MVFVGDKKYACETCIKGHRSSTCKHTDRPLYEIKKKGRPVTQCEHCRELRKTKQVHVKSSVKVPASAAFPSGLPEALEASVALQAINDASDSEYSGNASPAPCKCDESGVCNCWTTRVQRPRHKESARDRRGSTASRVSSTHAEEQQITQPAGLVVNAHAGDYRPVLPRPPSQRQPSPTGTVHDSSSISVHRHHPHHGQSFFSPYGRAYDYVHGSEHGATPDVPMEFQDSSSSSSTQTPGASQSEADPPVAQNWYSMLDFPPPNPPPISSVLCGCGPSCACPGCLEHRGPNVDPTASCTDPSTCMSCLDCAMLSLPVSLPPGSPSAAYSAPQMSNIDEWLRQMSSMVTPPTSQPLSPFPPVTPPGSGQVDAQSQAASHADMHFDPSMLQTYALWNNLGDARPVQAAPEECCGGRCKCPTGLCACAADCCGCCHGCSCPGCEHEDPSGPLTFATSGERASCCGGGSRHQSNSAPPSLPESASWEMAVAESTYQESNWSTQSLTVPRTSLSRASSFSSQSSRRSLSSNSSSLVSALAVATQSLHVESCCSSRVPMNTNMNG